MNIKHNKDCPYQAYPLPKECNCRPNLAYLSDIDLIMLNKELKDSREESNMEFRADVLKELKRRQSAIGVQAM